MDNARIVLNGKDELIPIDLLRNVQRSVWIVDGGTGEELPIGISLRSWKLPFDKPSGVIKRIKVGVARFYENGSVRSDSWTVLECPTDDSREGPLGGPCQWVDCIENINDTRWPAVIIGCVDCSVDTDGSWNGIADGSVVPDLPPAVVGHAPQRVTFSAIKSATYTHRFLGISRSAITRLPVEGTRFGVQARESSKTPSVDCSVEADGGSTKSPLVDPTNRWDRSRAQTCTTVITICAPL